ncbi:Uncharacterised protein [Klebsiella quasipneumoniae]|nr:Uncharacterised protein [Klebsiella quasipneumoniae]SLT74314.1 Uncharacterised protein [Klebsiella quasipneumoniae]SLT75043.1 Uncharacterised protein [Klebsiella quasipneumoniae]SLT76195.1 Uncharacterised protein [Klebsiella quasipneumoniae]SLU05059.1 Uncharacterised protein [Klebsiella quasipneumoniae]
MVTASSLVNEDYGPIATMDPPQKFVFDITSPLQA